ncbi:MAG: hypothetical protein WCD35_13480, partial [Mycobacteriales bacterium]
MQTMSVLSVAVVGLSLRASAQPHHSSAAAAPVGIVSDAVATPAPRATTRPAPTRAPATTRPPSPAP